MSVAEPSDPTTFVGFKVGEDVVEQLDKEAHKQSSPGDHVSRSEVIRDAIEEYLEDSG